MNVRHAWHLDRLEPFLRKLRGKSPALVVTLGDSNTCNAHYTAGAKQWPELLHAALKERFGYQDLLLVNAGICGDTILDGARRLERDVLRFRPDLTVVCFATNDAGRVDPATFRQELERVCRRLQTAGGAVLLRTTLPILERRPEPAHIWKADHDLQARLEQVRAVAREQGLAFFDTYAAWCEHEAAGRLDVGLLMADEVHSNAAGHRVVAEQLLQLFEAAG